MAFYAEDGKGLANHEPQVLIRGGHLRKLVIYTDLVAPDNGVRMRQDVPLTEVLIAALHVISKTPLVITVV